MLEEAMEEEFNLLFAELLRKDSCGRKRYRFAKCINRSVKTTR